MKRFELLLMVLQVPLDAVLFLLAGGSAYALRFSDTAKALKPILFEMTAGEYIQYLLWFLPVLIAVFALSGLYTPKTNRRFAQDTGRLFLAVLASLAVVALYILFTQQLFDSRFLIIVTCALSYVYIVIGRLVLRGIKGVFLRKGIGQKRVVLLGNDAVAKTLSAVFAQRPELGYRVMFSAKEFSPKVAARVQQEQIEEFILTNPRKNEEHAFTAMAYAMEHQIGFKYSADLFATLAANTTIHPLAGMPFVEIKPTKLDGWWRVVKRLVDIIGSVVVLLVMSPFLLITGIIIFIETGRPIIYKNTRVGQKGKEFITYKFRSMYQKDSTGKQFGESGEKALKKEEALIKKQSAKKGPIYKVANDPRVTPFGRYIRRWSIDEFPQFVNVLKGNMSIVGPRPHQPREVARYDKKHKVAFSVKPGITGLAQISGRSDLSYEEEMKLDVLYIEKWSVWLDFIILIKTPFILFKKRDVL